MIKLFKQKSIFIANMICGIIRDNYCLYYVLKKYFLKNKSNLLVHKTTDLVIEGYPRSANTFSVVAFEMINKNKKIAHHLHNLAQLKGAKKYKKPVLILFRNPEDAIKSLIVRHPEKRISVEVYNYLKYYKYVIKHAECFLICNFDTVLSRFDDVVLKINEKYNTNFFFKRFNKVDKMYIRNKIKSISKHNDVNVGGIGLAAPAKEKDIEKDKIIISNKLIKPCNDIYEKLKEHSLNLNMEKSGI